MRKHLIINIFAPKYNIYFYLFVSKKPFKISLKWETLLKGYSKIICLIAFTLNRYFNIFHLFFKE